MSADEKIQIYCGKKFEKYHKALEEKFSDAAFKAVPKSNLANINRVDPVMKAKISQLFSRKFEDEWPKDKDFNPIDDPTIILEHLLDWTFFTQCIRLGCKYDHFFN